MKKWIAIMLALVLALSLAGCGKDNASNDNGTAENGDTTPVAADSLELLTTVWDSYTEEEKFPVMGGDFDEANQNMEGPGKFGLEDTAALDSTLGLPADCAGEVLDAASLLHMMNANTFTCGAYQTKEGTDLEAFTAAIQDNIANRQWMCGFPDKLLIATVDNFVVSAFGSEDLINTFKDKLSAAYPETQVVCDQAIA